MPHLMLTAFLLFASVSMAVAHELRPAIADLEVTDQVVTLDITLNAEALVAGVNFEGISNTDESAQSDTVDLLRALPPEDLAARMREQIDGLIAPVSLLADGAPVTLAEQAIAVGEVGDVEIARDSRLTLTATLPAGTRQIELIWPAAYGALVLRQQGVDDPYTGYLEAGQSSGPIDVGGGGAVGAGQAFLQYIPVGFDHIVPKGLDHILFVLGLFFLSTRLRPLLWQVSAFTLAHTVTLALGALGLVNVPGSIVEPIIAASIVYVAVENILTDGLSRWRPVVVFLFGLLHGLGFASVLGDFGLPAGQFIPALIGFNVGVELGQLTVIALAFIAVGYWFGQKPWYRRAIAVPASVAIALIGAWWFLERTLLA